MNLSRRGSNPWPMPCGWAHSSSEVDVQDLIEELAKVDHSEIQRVYEQLLQDSENHLRAFVSSLERQTGESYQPQVLDQATYDQIISTTSGGGPGQGGRGRGRGE
jgi:hypothetical protein